MKLREREPAAVRAREQVDEGGRPEGDLHPPEDAAARESSGAHRPSPGGKATTPGASSAERAADTIVDGSGHYLEPPD
jgi:hypothetical protein